ncbi:hypothetical protein FFI97_025295 [Variovorax sp. KBS0712]|uniref:hypothetical protein n=1 Tax=Variovorax sp. KBS0712 TaxID=2578111 RepID=UPI00111BA124|nr:hypothetical protein [Variovorax sp. KBS0712]TSD54692.1 hypothetical protein FFI97_025295 [Variovorax sp. KBS0712]
MFDKNGYPENSQYDDELRSRRTTQARMRRNRHSGLGFEEEMFINSSRHLILHITTSYQRKYRNGVTLSTIQNHRDLFLRHIKEYPTALLQMVRGIIWKLEEGDRSGLHLHLLIFYSAQRKSDVIVAQEIGEHWVNEVTRGWGDYWNTNANKEKLKRWGVGIGQVNRHDNSKRESLQAFIANYMAKANQVPRNRTEDDKLFGMRFFDRLR